MFRVSLKLSLALHLQLKNIQKYSEPLRSHYSTKGHLAGTRLKSRSLTRVKGPETLPFLQGLVTNDLEHLETQPTLYTLFLNSGGRVVFDALLYAETPTLVKTSEGTGSGQEVSLLVESDLSLQSALINHLKLYRVRRKVQIDDVSTELRPWVIFDPTHKRYVQVTTVYSVQCKAAKILWIFQD